MSSYKSEYYGDTSAFGHHWALRDNARAHSVDVFEMGEDGVSRRVAQFKYRPVPGDNRPLITASNKARVDVAKRALQVLAPERMAEVA